MAQEALAVSVELGAPAAMEEAGVMMSTALAEAWAGRAVELDAPATDTPQNSENETSEAETANEIALKNGVYQEIRRKLNERFGIPPHEIAFIHDATTPAKKAGLFEAVNAGRVRVLIGSTAKLGTGVNVQKRLVALHHLDQPWKPAELEQREGRILRQGNIYPEVLVFHYVTERSFDGYMLQTLEAKARFISHIMAGEVTARTAEDVGEMVLTVAQVKAIASGNPLVQRRIETEVKLVKLDRLRAAFYQQQAALQAELEALPHALAAQATEIAGHEQAIQARSPGGAENFTITLKNTLETSATVVLTQRERAGARLRHWADLLAEQLRRSAGRQSVTATVGHYRGLQVAVHVTTNGTWAGVSSLFEGRREIHLSTGAGGVVYVANIGDSNVGVTQAMDYQLRNLETRLAQAQGQYATLHTRLAQAQAAVGAVWPHAAEYARLRRSYEAMSRELQAEGLPVAHTTDFAAPATLTNAIETDENALLVEGEDSLASSAETEPARNPLTGLENWPLVALEPEATAPVRASEPTREPEVAAVTEPSTPTAPAHIALLPFNEGLFASPAVLSEVAPPIVPPVALPIAHTEPAAVVLPFESSALGATDEFGGLLFASALVSATAPTAVSRPAQRTERTRSSRPRRQPHSTNRPNSQQASFTWAE